MSSFGALTYLRPEHRPDGAADRCLDCALEPGCAWSAKRLYLGMAERGEDDWPVEVVAWPPTPANVERALLDGPYGRCVWACYNDVVDHQVVALQFGPDVTASLTMTAFTRMRERETRIFGTHGELRGDGAGVDVYDFASGRTTHHPVEEEISSRHGGGDDGVMAAFVAAAAAGDPALVPTSPAETLATHRMAFAAEGRRGPRRRAGGLARRGTGQETPGRHRALAAAGEPQAAEESAASARGGGREPATRGVRQQVSHVGSEEHHGVSWCEPVGEDRVEKDSPGVAPPGPSALGWNLPTPRLGRLRRCPTIPPPAARAAAARWPRGRSVPPARRSPGRPPRRPRRPRR